MDKGGPERWVWLGLAIVVAAVTAAGLWSLGRRGAGTDELPVLGQVPDFELIERSGAPIRRADLAGVPWVADFIFTECSGVCPALSVRMAELRRQARDRRLPVRLVSFSVDPRRDTPEVLRAYAQRFGADDQSWMFLTGDRDELYELIGTGFRLSVAERTAEDTRDGGELITHSDRFVLVDAAGRIRAYYHGTESEAVPAVLRDLATLHADADG
jgi:cytochrome oxidase Cu insertion factor (SCO1/SenC/PrrC family)